MRMLKSVLVKCFAGLVQGIFSVLDGTPCSFVSENGTKSHIQQMCNQPRSLVWCDDDAVIQGG